MNFFHIIVAVFVLQETNAERIELLDDVEAVLGVFVDWLLIANAVIGDGDFLGVLLGSRMTRDDRVVQAIHAHRNGAGSFHVRLFQQDDCGVGVFLLGLKRGHRARGASSDNQDVAVEALGVVRNIIHGQIPLSVEV